MRKTTRTLAGLGLTLLLLTGCDNFQPAQKVKIQPAAVPPAQEKNLDRCSGRPHTSKEPKTQDQRRLEQRSV